MLSAVLTPLQCEGIYWPGISLNCLKNPTESAIKAGNFFAAATGTRQASRTRFLRNLRPTPRDFSRNKYISVRLRTTVYGAMMRLLPNAPVFWPVGHTVGPIDPFTIPKSNLCYFRYSIGKPLASSPSPPQPSHSSPHGQTVPAPAGGTAL